jgi:HEAT repeat protein
LINALNHPERETVQRAVWILGRIGSVAAVRPLIALFNETSNPFLKTAILNAMGGIGTPEAMDLIVKSINSEMSMVKLRAREIVEQVWGAREKK